MKDLLSVADLDRAGIEELLDLTDHFVEVNRRSIPKVPALRGKTVVSLFYEDSTRTRLSFETAAKRLGADTMTFSVSTSSRVRSWIESRCRRSGGFGGSRSSRMTWISAGI